MFIGIVNRIDQQLELSHYHKIRRQMYQKGEDKTLKKDIIKVSKVLYF